MSYSTLAVDVRDGVAHLRLNRPDDANGITLELTKELLDVAIRFESDDAVRAVLITGAGKMFCGGGDLKAFSKVDDLAHHLREVTAHLHAALAGLARLDAPVIAAVHGSAAGAGFSLVCGCDIVLAARSAKFVMAYTRAGLTPDGSGSWYLPRLVGARRAFELAVENRVLTADEALEWGLITRVVDDETLFSEAEALAATLAAGPTLAYGGTKRLLFESWNASLDTQMARETELIARAAASDDGREGVAAFVEKRAPKFSGR